MRDDEEITSMRQRIALMEDAFVRDDLGKPDFHAHRKTHLQEVKQSERMEEIKDSATRQLLMWVIGIVLAAIAGFWGLR